jgi:hypothetical protein|eukprot:COSAG06_NODE_3935_length_4748_cov_248.001291_5_plen_57_part_00
MEYTYLWVWMELDGLFIVSPDRVCVPRDEDVRAACEQTGAFSFPSTFHMPVPSLSW